jgi:hypothetical protein
MVSGFGDQKKQPIFGCFNGGVSEKPAQWPPNTLRQSRRREALVNCPSNANVLWPSRAAPLDAWARKTVVRGILQFGRVLCGDAQV